MEGQRSYGGPQAEATVCCRLYKRSFQPPWDKQPRGLAFFFETDILLFNMINACARRKYPDISAHEPRPDFFLSAKELVMMRDEQNATD